MTRLSELLRHGQSPWLDYIRRSLLTTGQLQQMVERDGITGVTSNPTIFDKAISGSSDYDGALRSLLASEPGLDAPRLYERLAVQDVAMAADVLRSVYDRSSGQDGFVSLEVAPELAHDTAGTIAAARRLWSEVARPNLLIKVPATPEGVAALEQLISEGINVNVTLMFSLTHYEAVAQAYRRGAARAKDPTRLASVASVFVSRIDTAVDRVLDASTAPAAKSLRGRIAIANSRVIYARFRELWPAGGPASSAVPSAPPQRVLWASTSTKDPVYRDTLYVEELVGPQTVDTIPPATLTAFEDHGVVRGDTLLDSVPEARATLERARAAGVDLERICEELQDEGVKAFADSYAHLLESLDRKRIALLEGAVDRATWSLGANADLVGARWDAWERDGVPARFWKRDPTLWPAAPASDVATRMGWLELPERMHDELPRILEFVESVRKDGVRDVVVLGMGGSSLAPEVFSETFGARPGYPRLRVLDSTHPDAIDALRRDLDLRHTLFLVSSKSGTTIEPLSFYRFFAERVREATGADPGPSFVAITDPGTFLEELAAKDRFRAVFRALPTVGGRYSALTMFGLVPAALAGVDVRGILDRAWTMAEACASSVPVRENPGLLLGAIVGECATHGRDKLTFGTSPGFSSLPMWLEQLVAESTGKIGKGIVPVADEPPVSSETYGPDRQFVEIQEQTAVDSDLSARMDRLASAGVPVVRIRLPGRLELAEEFFRWEMAVASAGMIVGIDPYDQPDVELAKELARKVMEQPKVPGGEADVTTVPVADGAALRAAVAAWSGSAHPGDYVSIQAYLAPTESVSTALRSIRRDLLMRWKLATTFGYGPRFLHSTGQLHKGGPNTGLFLQIVDTPRQDLPVPTEAFTFGELIHAQAVGDYRALRQKGRRVLRVDLGSDVEGGLRRLAEALRA